MYCRKCGNKLEGNQKFCGKCGTKVVDAEKDNNENIINNFITNGNKSKDGSNVNNNDENSFISSTIGNNSSQLNNNYVNTSKVDKDNNTYSNNKSVSKKTFSFSNIFNNKSKLKKRKIKRKNKYKVLSKKRSTKRSTKGRIKKQHKKLNKNLKFGILAGIILCIVVCTVILKLKWKFINAHNYVIASFENTYKQVNDLYTIKQFDNLKIYDSDNNVQNMFLKIKDAKGGMNNNNILKSLKGLSLNIGYLKDFNQNVNNYEFVFRNNKKKITSIDMMSTENDTIFWVPELYDGQIGLNNQLVDKAVYSGKYQAINDLSKVIDDNGLFFEINNLIDEKNKSVFYKIINQCKISYTGEDNENKIRNYKATIDGKVFIDSLNEYFDLIGKDDKIINVLTDFIYVTRGEKTLKDSKKASTKIISSIKNCLENIQEEDIDKVSFTLDTSNKFIDNVGMELLVKNIKLKFNFATNSQDSSLEYKLKFNIIDVIKNINLNMCFSGDKLNDTINKDMNISLDVLDKKVIGISIGDKFNIKTLSIRKYISTDIKDEYDIHKCNIDLVGKFIVSDDVKKFNIEELRTNITTLFSNIFLNFEGYIEKTNTNNINIIERNNVEYINILDTDTTNLIEDKINMNFNNIINSFINCRL